jgi:glycosyltransferase involved in cell wall biosynthesis
MEQAGLRIVPLRKLSRSSLNPFRELVALGELIAVYRKERPDLVHQVALKPVIYGSIAARFANVSSIVNALAGLGFAFSSRSLLARLLKPALVGAFRLIFNNPGSRLILQNTDDLDVVTKEARVDRRNICLIRSAGVDLLRYKVREHPSAPPIVLLASRMLWDKGVGEFVKVANLLRQQGLVARFVLAGEPDSENPSSITRRQLQEWNDSGEIEWWGHRNDMPEVLSQARIVCLPSYYGEGIPKVLIEAMASGRPIVTTDMPGCKDVVRTEKNGLLVKPRNVDDLAKALKVLLLDESKCQEMGREGRRIAEIEYALSRVVAETLAIYRELLKKRHSL